MNAMDTAVGKIATAVKGNAKLYERSIMVFSTVSCLLSSICAASCRSFWRGWTTQLTAVKMFG